MRPLPVTAVTPSPDRADANQSLEEGRLGHGTSCSTFFPRCADPSRDLASPLPPERPLEPGGRLRQRWKPAQQHEASASGRSRTVEFSFTAWYLELKAP